MEHEYNDFVDVVDDIYERRNCFEYGRHEYLVLTDDEADQKADEHSQNLIDEMLHSVPDTIKYYFDEERYLEDTRADSRSTLAGYDGYEHASGDYYIFTN